MRDRKKKPAKKSPPKKTAAPLPAKVWPRHIVGWVEPAFFDEKAKVRSMTIHGAPRQVGGVAIDVPVIVMENRHGFSIQPKAQVREVVASRPSTPATT